MIGIFGLLCFIQLCLYNNLIGPLKSVRRNSYTYFWRRLSEVQKGQVVCKQCDWESDIKDPPLTFSGPNIRVQMIVPQPSDLPCLSSHPTSIPFRPHSVKIWTILPAYLWPQCVPSSLGKESRILRAQGQWFQVGMCSWPLRILSLWGGLCLSEGQREASKMGI